MAIAPLQIEETVDHVHLLPKSTFVTVWLEKQY